MARTVGKQTTAVLRELLGERLQERLGNATTDLEQAHELREPLLRWLKAQRRRTGAGERGRALEAVVHQLGLAEDWNEAP